MNNNSCNNIAFDRPSISSNSHPKFQAPIFSTLSPPPLNIHWEVGGCWWGAAKCESHLLKSFPVINRGRGCLLQLLLNRGSGKPTEEVGRQSIRHPETKVDFDDIYAKADYRYVGRLVGPGLGITNVCFLGKSVSITPRCIMWCALSTQELLAAAASDH